MNLIFFSPTENNFFTSYFFSLIIGFFFGSIPFGYLIAKTKNIDIRSFGSKNIGFSNVNRVLGLRYGLPVLVLDIAKGFLPTLFAHQLGAVAVLVGLGAILGHNFTPWLGFKGGKGVATTIGVMLSLIPLALLSGILVFIVIALSFSYISLASLSFAVTLPIFVLILYHGEKVIFGLTVASALLIIIRHRDNIVRIINNTEPKIQISKFFRKNI